MTLSRPAADLAQPDTTRPGPGPRMMWDHAARVLGDVSSFFPGRPRAVLAHETTSCRSRSRYIINKRLGVLGKVGRPGRGEMAPMTQRAEAPGRSPSRPRIPSGDRPTYFVGRGGRHDAGVIMSRCVCDRKPPAVARAGRPSCAASGRDPPRRLSPRCAAKGARSRGGTQTYLPFPRTHAVFAIDQGLAIHFPAPHSYTGRGGARAPGPRRSGRAATAPCNAASKPAKRRLGLPPGRTGRVHPSARSSTTSSIWPRPEAVSDLIEASTEAAARLGRALAQWLRSRPRSTRCGERPGPNCACWSRRRFGLFPGRKRSTFLEEGPMHAGACQRAVDQTRWRCSKRRRRQGLCCWREKAIQGRCWPAQPERRQRARC